MCANTIRGRIDHRTHSAKHGNTEAASGYLKGLRDLADKHGFILIFDEVKTGFRYSIGGYSKLGGVRPDLAVFAKAMAKAIPSLPWWESVT